MPPEVAKNSDQRISLPVVVGEAPSLKHICLLIIIGLLVLGPGLGKSIVSLNAEERIWKVTQTMLETKNFIVPYIDGHPHLTKPPLYYWMSSVTGLVLQRDDPIVVRIPAVFCAVAAAVLTYLLGCSLQSRQLGFLAAVILLSFRFFVDRSHQGTFDIALTVAVLLALYGAWEWINAGKKSGVLFLLLGSWLGFMIKGPVAWLVISIPFVGYLLLRRELKRLITLKSAALLAAVLLLSSLWFDYLLIYEPISRKIFREELLLPLGAPAEHHTASHYGRIYKYAGSLSGDLLPWSLYLPLIALYFIRKPLVTRQSPMWFLLIWFGGNLFFFSLVPSKQAAYLFPLYPAIAIIVAWHLVAALRGLELEKSWLRYSNLGIGLLCLPLAPALAVAFWLRADAPTLICLSVGIITAVAGVAAFLTALRRRNKQSLAVIIIGWLLLIPLIYSYFMPMHRYLHENRNSPEEKAYEKRSQHLRQLFNLKNDHGHEQSNS